ncbi:restriction endonuclease subunit S [Kaistella sp.]|uniref:restriction endonuclease subunit S n=1 Tax=Kaistella sp. TaxID=2782235 RepID=UPI002F93743A
MTEKLKGKNFPTLRFPGFEAEWEVKKLGDIMDFKVTNSFSRENLNYETGTVKNIHYGDIHTKFQTLFDVEQEKVPYINTDISLLRISEDFFCKEGDIVFADASEDLNDVGKSIEILNLRGEKVLAGLHTMLARPHKDYFHKGFNGFLLTSDNVRNQIKKEAQGSKVLSINVGRISKIELSIPSIEEQYKITVLLSLIDKRLATQRKIISHLQTSIRSYREKLLSQEIRFNNEKGNNFPEWETKKIKHILKIGSGRDYKHLDVGNIPVYGTGGVITFVNSFLYDGETVCIGRKGTIDKPMYFNGKLWTVDTLFYTHSFNNCIPKFIFQIFQRINWKEHNEASGVPSLSKNTIENISVTIPSVKEQTKIGDFLSSIDEKIETEKNILAQYELQKKYLLANLFA